MYVLFITVSVVVADFAIPVILIFVVRVHPTSHWCCRGIKGTGVDQTDLNRLENILLPQAQLIIDKTVFFKRVGPGLDVVVEMVQMVLTNLLFVRACIPIV